MKIQRKITLIRHKMRQVWSSSGEQNSVKQASECAVYLTSIQLDQQTIARANYRLSTPSFSKLVGYSLAHCSLSQLRNNVEFNTNSDHAKILPNHRIGSVYTDRIGVPKPIRSESVHTGCPQSDPIGDRSDRIGHALCLQYIRKHREVRG